MALSPSSLSDDVKIGRGFQPYFPVSFSPGADEPPATVNISLTSNTSNDKRMLKFENSTPIMIGRASKSGIKNLSSNASNALFDCPVVSRAHAELKVSRSLGRDAVLLTDLSSRHGTSINGVRLPPGKSFALRSGDVIKLGDLVTRGEGESWLYESANDDMDLTDFIDLDSHDGISLTYRTIDHEHSDNKHPSVLSTVRHRTHSHGSYHVPSASEDSDSANDSDGASVIITDDEKNSSANTTPEQIKTKLGSLEHPIDLDATTAAPSKHVPLEVENENDTDYDHNDEYNENNNFYNDPAFVDINDDKGSELIDEIERFIDQDSSLVIPDNLLGSSYSPSVRKGIPGAHSKKEAPQPRLVSPVLQAPPQSQPAIHRGDRPIAAGKSQDLGTNNVEEHNTGLRILDSFPNHIEATGPKMQRQVHHDTDKQEALASKARRYQNLDDLDDLPLSSRSHAWLKEHDLLEQAALEKAVSNQVTPNQATSKPRYDPVRNSQPPASLDWITSEHFPKSHSTYLNDPLSFGPTIVSSTNEQSKNHRWDMKPENMNFTFDGMNASERTLPKMNDPPIALDDNAMEHVSNPTQMMRSQFASSVSHPGWKYPAATPTKNKISIQDIVEGPKDNTAQKTNDIAVQTKHRQCTKRKFQETEPSDIIAPNAKKPAVVNQAVTASPSAPLRHRSRPHRGTGSRIADVAKGIFLGTVGTIAFLNSSFAERLIEHLN